jgi:hypothetical protein
MRDVVTSPAASREDEPDHQSTEWRKPPASVIATPTPRHLRRLSEVDIPTRSGYTCSGSVVQILRLLPTTDECRPPRPR